MKAETTCQWYMTEEPGEKAGENTWFNFVHCTDEHGFCILQDLFTKCKGKCELYIKEKDS